MQSYGKGSGGGGSARSEASRANIACASPRCTFRVHSRPQLGGFCCIACRESLGGDHGPRCERQPAPPGAQKANAAWEPMGGEKLAGIELADAQRLLSQQLAGDCEQESMLGGAISFGRHLEVPLVHDGNTDGPRITIFFREVVHAAHAATRGSLPVLLHLHDGPGFPAMRPGNANDGWLGRALRDHRVLLVDPRGTGRSTLACTQTLRLMSSQEQAEYLQHFRADAIVDDCEKVRQALKVRKFTILGEGYGGFIALTYVSRHPNSLSAVLLTGGLPPILADGPDEVYRVLYPRVVARNRRYYARYPGDAIEVREIVEHLEEEGGVPLPSGGMLTPRRFLSLGHVLAGGLGLEAMHWLVADAFVDVDGERELDFRFLTQIDRASSFETHPLCWLLHELIYCGSDTGASAWSAQRVMAEAPFRDIFDYKAALNDPSMPPLFFTGDMVYPWFTEDFSMLGALRGAAELLAAKSDWPDLYDLDLLRKVTVPIAVVVDTDNMQTDPKVTKAVAAHLGDKCNVWVSEEFQYLGLCEGVFDTLLRMADGFHPRTGVRGLPPTPGDAGPMDKSKLESLELQEAKHLLWPDPSWQSTYKALRKRIREGAEEELLPGGVLSRGRYVGVPLDHAGDPEGQSILVFFREVIFVSHLDKKAKMPVLLFLVGGPGFPAPKPSGSDAWLSRALQDHRVLLLDQRGTGRSAPVTAQTLRGMSPEEQAEYLSHFRADAIVEDCEAVRRSLGLDKLCLLGESFGGFCNLTYLSRYPESLSAVMFTGGLAPVLATGADEVYRYTYKRMVTRNQRYYARYPGDVAKVRDIVAYLDEKGGVPLPAGGRLTARRFLALGLLLGSGFGLESMHHIVESAFVDVGQERELDLRFLVQVETIHNFDTNPLFWMLHEPIYCEPETGPGRWAAGRVLEEEPYRELYDYRVALRDPQQPPVLFTGEHVYSWFAEDFATLEPLREAAELLAQKQWPELYNVDRLRNTKVPCAAHVDSEDIYVEVELSQATAELLGRNCKLWISDEFQHSGLGDSVGGIIDRLVEMAKGKDLPSPLRFPSRSTDDSIAKERKRRTPAAVHPETPSGGGASGSRAPARAAAAQGAGRAAAAGHPGESTAAGDGGALAGEVVAATPEAPEAPEAPGSGAVAPVGGAAWVVVGGKVLVRSGHSLATPSVGHLQFGSKVREVSRIDGRLQYEKLAGEGPETGWVSLEVKGRKLLSPV